ncbi:MAG: hypothetical protein LBH20_01540 [Treponema sp.]|jgi:hypothetical protein|nr:hypothetical protein [Treponema sp.]
MATVFTVVIGNIISTGRMGGASGAAKKFLGFSARGDQRKTATRAGTVNAQHLNDNDYTVLRCAW